MQSSKNALPKAAARDLKVLKVLKVQRALRQEAVKLRVNKAEAQAALRVHRAKLCQSQMI